MGYLEPGSDFLAGVICLYLSRKTSYWGPRLVARPFPAERAACSSSSSVPVAVVVVKVAIVAVDRSRTRPVLLVADRRCGRQQLATPNWICWRLLTPLFFYCQAPTSFCWVLWKIKEPWLDIYWKTTPATARPAAPPSSLTPCGAILMLGKRVWQLAIHFGVWGNWKMGVLLHLPQLLLKLLLLFQLLRFP